MSTCREPLPRALVGLTLGLVILSVLLALQNHRLKSQLRTILGPPEALAAGDRVPPFAAVGLEGQPLHIDYGLAGHATLLFLFSPTCRTCVEALPVWESLWHEVAQWGVRVVGLSLDRSERTRTWVEENGVRFSVASLPDDELRFALKVQRVPLTALVGGEGKVLYAYTGVLPPEEEERLLALAIRKAGP